MGLLDLFHRSKPKYPPWTRLASHSVSRDPLKHGVYFEATFSHEFPDEIVIELVPARDAPAMLGLSRVAWSYNSMREEFEPSLPAPLPDAPLVLGLGVSADGFVFLNVNGKRRGFITNLAHFAHPPLVYVHLASSSKHVHVNFGSDDFVASPSERPTCLLPGEALGASLPLSGAQLLALPVELLGVVLHAAVVAQCASRLESDTARERGGDHEGSINPNRNVHHFVGALPRVCKRFREAQSSVEQAMWRDLSLLRFPTMSETHESTDWRASYRARNEVLLSTHDSVIGNCKLEYECPLALNKLRHTADVLVRFCSVCERNVYIARTLGEIEEIGRRGDCMAFVRGFEHVPRVAGMIARPHQVQRR